MRFLAPALLGTLLLPTAYAQPAAEAPTRSRPAQVIPTGVETPALDAAAADSLSPEQLARRIARLRVRQAELLEAEASGQSRRYQEILDGLVADLQLLAALPGVAEDARFRDVFASIMGEYERFYDEPMLDRGEIYPFLQAAFADLNAVDGPLLEDVELPEFSASAVAVAATIPMEVNRLVERSLSYLRRSDGHTSRLRTRADTYFPMIERILAEEGVPDELKYLAMVESALNPRARSHAGAAGLWQFIPATGRAYGLRVTSEIDDRLDPEKSTRAAAQHLRDLYERFGDWHLALAGYNCNPARIQRAIQTFESRTGRRATFWDIYNDIPSETRNYVPMFIATALLLSNPDHGGERGAMYTYDQVPVRSGTTLREVAQLIGTSTDVLEALNPSLRRSRVPEQRDPWMLRIPVGSYSRNASDLDALAPRYMPDRTAFAAQTVHYGARNVRPLAPADEAELVAARRPRSEGSTRLADAARRLREERGEREPSRTERPRETTRDAEPAATEPATPVRTVADEAPERETRRTTPRRSEIRSPRTQTHRVRRGENLTQIAARYGVSVGQIRAANNLSTDTIRPGQRLRIDPSASASSARSSGGSRARTTTHTVRRGENLTQIARRYGVTVSQIREWNRISGSNIRPGQRLRIESRRTVS